MSPDVKKFFTHCLSWVSRGLDLPPESGALDEWREMLGVELLKTTLGDVEPCTIAALNYCRNVWPSIRKTFDFDARIGRKQIILSPAEKAVIKGGSGSQADRMAT